MLRFFYLGVALSVAFGLGCGATMSDGPSLGGSGSDGGGDSASTSNADASADTRGGSTAPNGVPIPEPDPRDTCAALGIELAPCGAYCAPLRCDCEGTSLQFGGPGCYGACVTRVSCPTACALGRERATLRAFFCAEKGVCKTDQDCKPMSHCLIAPGDASGICATGGAGSDCFQDADCAALLYPPGMGNPTGVWSACVLAFDVRHCSSGLTGSPCNRHEQCRDKKCINRANSYEGTCTNGANDQVCLVDADCKALRGKCVAGICSDGTPGSFCMTDDDCYGNFCVRDPVTGGPSVCDTGKEGSKCIDASDCAVPICLGDTCSSGAAGQACWRDEHCVSGKCSDIEPYQGHCTDGKAGQECRFDGQQCEAGLRCARTGDQPVFVCTESDAGAPGDARVD